MPLTQQETNEGFESLISQEVVRLQNDRDALRRAKWDDLRTRNGKFFIGSRFLQESSDELFKLFARVIVVRCEYLYTRDGLMYDALSPEFDPNPEYLEAPEYLVRITVAEGGDRESRFEKVKP